MLYTAHLSILLHCLSSGSSSDVRLRPGLGSSPYDRQQHAWRRPQTSLHPVHSRMASVLHAGQVLHGSGMLCEASVFVLDMAGMMGMLKSSTSRSLHVSRWDSSISSCATDFHGAGFGSEYVRLL